MDNPKTLGAQGTQDDEKHSKNTTQYVVDTYSSIMTSTHIFCLIITVV